MVLHQHLSSAQQLLHLAHTQAQQMLALAYEQAQQLLALAKRQQFSPPPLMSVCKVHHRPGCSLAPCSQILYNQSKVTCEKLHAELFEISRHSKNFATNVNTQTHQCTNHPERTNPYCITQAQTQKIPFGPKSNSPPPTKLCPTSPPQKRPRGSPQTMQPDPNHGQRGRAHYPTAS